MVILKATLKEQNILVLLISLRGCSSIMQSVAEEPQKLPLAQMGGGVSCDHAIMRSKRVGRGVSQKLTFAHKGGVGAWLWKGAKFIHVILEHPTICFQPSSSPD